MTIFHAIILGAIQGLTEFLPISSSAHLYLVPYVFGWDYQGLGFDVALHWGTLLAVLAVFGKDYIRFLRKDRRMVWLLVLGCLPAAVIGFFFKDQAETVFRHPLVSVVTLVGFAWLLNLADKKTGEENLNVLDQKKTLAIGLAQSLALVPGVSRSGITMTAGMFSGLTREAAAKFSFILSGPVIFGAGLVALPDVTQVTGQLAAGFLAAAVSGFLAIKFLLKYLNRHGFKVFVWYRVILAVVILFIYLSR